MADAARDAVITGIGLVSSLGEGVEAHRAAMHAGKPVLDSTSYAPRLVHPIVALEYDRQIPKRGDQRQMEPWQRIGTYAAGLALEHAGVKGNTELLDRTHMLVAAGGGERDYAVDAAILTGLRTAPHPEAYLNEHLLNDLRPTLFLAQLSNLLAGNISVVHGVVGSSRTLMGEEAAGADAVRIACSRIAAGQGELFLVGGSFNAQRLDNLLQNEMGGLVFKQDFAGIWSRQALGGGLVMGSLGCFLVIESRAHAKARGAVAHAHIAGIRTDRSARQPGQATANAERQWQAMRHMADPAATIVMSGASGAAAPTQEEARFLAGVGLPVRATATMLGHSFEPSFVANLALAADAVEQGAVFGALDAGEAKAPSDVRHVAVTSWGHWRGESMALVERA
jgi:3-oxoacyl-[acyl-carrier-protein] synthase II